MIEGQRVIAVIPARGGSKSVPKKNIRFLAGKPLICWSIDVAKREASIDVRDTGLADALVTLHKSPGPHLVGIRMNWFPMRVWFWFADAAVYLLWFITVSGLWLWYALRADRRIGLALLAAGAVSCFGLVYAIVH